MLPLGGVAAVAAQDATPAVGPPRGDPPEGVVGSLRVGPRSRSPIVLADVLQLSSKARARKGIPEGLSAAELEGLLTVVLRGVIVGRVEVGRANAAANVARALIAAKEAGTIEERLAALEEGAGIREGKTA